MRTTKEYEEIIKGLNKYIEQLEKEIFELKKQMLKDVFKEQNKKFLKKAIFLN